VNSNNNTDKRNTQNKGIHRATLSPPYVNCPSHSPEVINLPFPAEPRTSSYIYADKTEDVILCTTGSQGPYISS